MRFMLAVAVIITSVTSARADLCNEHTSRTILAGPVVGLLRGKHAGPVVGFEGGVGCGPMRLDLGFEHRDHKGLGYVALDAWHGLGATFGLGLDTGGVIQGIGGVWEGVPTHFPTCRPDNQTAVLFSFGYRFTGVHELFVSLKAGRIERASCL